MNHDAEIEAWQAIAELWARPAKWLAGQMASCQAQLDDAAQTKDMADVRHIQGRLEAYKLVLSLPQARLRKLGGDK